RGDRRDVAAAIVAPGGDIIGPTGRGDLDRRGDLLLAPLGDVERLYPDLRRLADVAAELHGARRLLADELLGRQVGEEPVWIGAEDMNIGEPGRRAPGQAVPVVVGQGQQAERVGGALLRSVAGGVGQEVEQTLL